MARALVPVRRRCRFGRRGGSGAGLGAGRSHSGAGLERVRVPVRARGQPGAGSTAGGIQFGVGLECTTTKRAQSETLYVLAEVMPLRATSAR